MPNKSNLAFLNVTTAKLWAQQFGNLLLSFAVNFRASDHLYSEMR